jgi:hypothetical protein
MDSIQEQWLQQSILKLWLWRKLYRSFSGWLTRQKDTGEQSVRKEALEIEGGQTYAVKTDICVAS